MSAKMKTFRKTAAALYVAFIMVFAFTAQASAHPTTASSLNITVKEKTVELETVIPLDAFNKAADTQIETNAQAGDSEAAKKYLLKHVEITVENQILPLEIVNISLDDSRGQKDLTATMIAVSDAPITSTITVKDDAVINTDKSHSIYLYLVSDWAAGTLSHDEPVSLSVLANFNISYDLERDGNNVVAGFITSIQLGFSHIAGGYDHLLFLAMLLVPAPMIAGKGNFKTAWGEKRSWKNTLRQVLWIVSAFTVGHSLSLIVVTLTNAQYSSFAVEFLVAGSVGLAAAHAVKPLVQRGEIWIAGIFGLVHGTAFAGTLQHLNLETWPLVQALIGFNVGIELAQLTAVALVLPLIWFASRWKYYYIVRITLAVLGVTACIFWIVNLVASA